MLDTDHPKLKKATCCDSEDIVYQVEVAFGIELTPEECGRMITVGDLHDTILEKLGSDLGEGCVSQAAYHGVRRVLMEHYGAARDAIGLDRNLLDLVPALGPKTARRREWKALSDRLQCYLPELGYSKIESTTLFMIAIACLTPACWNPWLLLGLLVVIGLVWRVLLKLLNRFVPSLFASLPKECLTIGGLVKTITKRNYGTIARQRGFRNEADVWKILSEIMVDELGVKPEEIRKDARLREDLRID